MNMCKPILLLVLFMTALPAGAAGPSHLTDVPMKLADIPAIKAWAENNWGGSSVDVLKSGEAEVVAVQRSFTSGLLTSGLVVFIRIEDHWEPGLIFRTVTGYRYKFAQEGDYVHLRSDPSGKEIGGFLISAIGQDYVGQMDSAKPESGRDAAQQSDGPVIRP